MPIGLDPNQTLDLELKIDAEKPAATRPVFVARFLTSREMLQVNRLYGQAADRSDQAAATGAELDAKSSEISALLDEAIGVFLVGWRNMIDRDKKPIEFAPMADVARGGRRVRDVDKILTLDEKFELVAMALAHARVEEALRKKSSWRSASSRVPSVATAGAPAPTSRP